MMHPNTESWYRANTARAVPYSHKRKQCGCGKRVTAKQLTDYGKCDACYRATKSIVLVK